MDSVSKVTGTSCSIVYLMFRCRCGVLSAVSGALFDWQRLGRDVEGKVRRAPPSSSSGENSSGSTPFSGCDRTECLSFCRGAPQQGQGGAPCACVCVPYIQHMQCMDWYTCSA